MLHPCNCIKYNGKQCYNCLNGAHENCDSCRQKNDRVLGLPIKIVKKKSCVKIKT